MAEPELVVAEDAVEPDDLAAVADAFRTSKPFFRQLPGSVDVAEPLAKRDREVVDRAEGCGTGVHTVGVLQRGPEFVKRLLAAGGPQCRGDRNERAGADFLQPELVRERERLLAETNCSLGAIGDHVKPRRFGEDPRFRRRRRAVTDKLLGFPQVTRSTLDVTVNPSRLSFDGVCLRGPVDIP